MIEFCPEAVLQLHPKPTERRCLECAQRLRRVPALAANEDVAVPFPRRKVQLDVIGCDEHVVIAKQQHVAGRPPGSRVTSGGGTTPALTEKLDSNCSFIERLDDR